MVCGPELARCFFEFVKALSFNLERFGNDDRNHHKQTRSMQQRFTKHVLSLLNILDEAGNPFLDESPDLITLGTKNIADTKAIETLNNVERIGTEKKHKFVEERLKTIFRLPVQRSISKKNEITTLKKSSFRNCILHVRFEMEI